MAGVKLNAAYYEQQGREYARDAVKTAYPGAHTDSTSWQAHAFKRGYDDEVIQMRVSAGDLSILTIPNDCAMPKDCALQQQLQRVANYGDVFGAPAVASGMSPSTEAALDSHMQALRMEWHKAQAAGDRRREARLSYKMVTLIERWSN